MFGSPNLLSKVDASPFTIDNENLDSVDSVRNIGALWTILSIWMIKSTMSAKVHGSIFVTWVKSVHSLTMPLQKSWFMPSSLPSWTQIMVYLLESQRKKLIFCRECIMLLPGWLPAPQSMSI